MEFKNKLSLKEFEVSNASCSNLAGNYHGEKKTFDVNKNSSLKVKICVQTVWTAQKVWMKAGGGHGAWRIWVAAAWGWHNVSRLQAAGWRLGVPTEILPLLDRNHV